MYYVITNPALSHYRKNFAVSSHTLKSDASKIHTGREGEESTWELSERQ